MLYLIDYLFEMLLVLQNTALMTGCFKAVVISTIGEISWLCQFKSRDDRGQNQENEFFLYRMQRFKKTVVILNESEKHWKQYT